MNRIVARFRDVADVINHRPQYRTFWSPVFGGKYAMSREDAVKELDGMIRKSGFTRKELVNLKSVEVRTKKFLLRIRECAMMNDDDRDRQQSAR